MAANPNVTFDPVTGTLTFTSPADGASMADLIIDLPITADGISEGTEAFTLTLDNASSSLGGQVSLDAEAASHSTTVIDAEGPVVWSISGLSNVDEDGIAEYILSLSGVFAEGETVSIDINLRDIDTTSDDYTSFVEALRLAVAENPDFTFTLAEADQRLVNRLFGNLFQNDDASGVTGTLTFTSPADGATAPDLLIELPVNDDSFIENPEDFAIDIFNAQSTTGIPVSIAQNSLVTTIDNNDFAPNGEPPLGAAASDPVAFVPTEFSAINILEFAEATDGLTRFFSGGDDVILNAINDIQSLDALSDDAKIMLRFEDSTLFTKGFDLRLHTNFRDQPVSEGFSSGKGYPGTHSIDPTDECGRVFIDTLVLGDNLAIMVHDTFDSERSPDVVRFSATLANGEPLPTWISETADGEYIVHRSVSSESIYLRITAHRDNAADLVRQVEINLLTGLINDTTNDNDQASEQQASGF